MNLHSLRRSRRPWALALVLAVLLLASWGQMHRVLHPQTSAVSALPAAPGSGHGHGHGHGHLHDAHTPLGHPAGGGLCVLFDHLADGNAALQVPSLPSLSRPPACLLQPVHLSLAAVHAKPFDARGPPPLA